MLVSFWDYIDLGFELVPEPEFKRFQAMAEAAVMRFTFGRVSADCITRTAKYGVCELVDAFFEDSRQSSHGPLTGFTNEGYSESYASGGGKTAIERAEDIILMYFGQEETWRGVQPRQE